MTEPDNPRQDISLLYRILALRNEKSFRAERSHLRRGADESTQHYAFPYVYPALPENSHPTQKLALTRLAAMAAEFTGVPEFKATENSHYKSFGRWCFEISRAVAAKKGKALNPNPKDPDVIAQRLAYLHTQDIEEAMRTVRRLLQIAESIEPTPRLDYIALYRLLQRWGNGISQESREVRMAPLRDYYGAFGSQNNDQEPPSY